MHIQALQINKFTFYITFHKRFQATLQFLHKLISLSNLLNYCIMPITHIKYESKFKPNILINHG